MARVLVGLTDTPSGPGVSDAAGDDCGADGVVQYVKLDGGADGVSAPIVSIIPGHLPVSGSVSVSQPSLTAAAPTSASVGIASAQAVAANANRKGLVLVNRSNNVVSLGFGLAAVLDDGISLEPMGGSFTMTKDTFTTVAVNAIAGGAASKLGVQEYS